MNSEWRANRKAWVAALRDPSRKQVAGRLGHQSTGGQCCLGVLAEVAGCTHRRDEEWFDSWDGVDGEAPKRAMEFVGLRSPCGQYTGSKTLIALNDNGFTFAEIADVIEREPQGLFR